MKVGIVYPFFAHYRGPIIEALDDSNEIEYHFLGGAKKNEAYSSLKLYDFNDKENFNLLNNIWIGNHFLFQTNLLRELKRNKFDAVVFLGDWKYFSTWIGVWYLNFIRTPTLFWAHGLLNEKKSLNNRIKLLFYNQFKYGGFVYDNRAFQIFNRLKYRRPVNVIYNSLDYEKQTEVYNSLIALESRANQHEITPYLVFTGRLIPERKLEILFDAINALKVNKRFVRVVVVGSGPHEKTLKSYVDSLMISDQIDFVGPCYDETVLGKYFVGSIGCVFPGPIGLTAIHALTYGTLVLTNDNIAAHKPEIEAVVDGHTGILFKDGDVDSLAQKIDYLINLPSVKREEFRANALEFIGRTFTPKNQRTIMTDVLIKLKHRI